MKRIVLCVGLLCTGCASLNQEHYDTLMSLPPRVDALEKQVAQISRASSPAQKDLTAAKSTEAANQSVDARKKDSVSDSQSGAELWGARMRAAMGAGADVRVQASSPRTVHITMQHRILFASGSATLSDSGKAFLRKFARVAENLPEDAHVRIIGHSDNRQLSWQTRQKFKDNMALSQARAEAVRTWLLENSRISPDILFAEGRGASEPIGNNGTRDGRALNRRIEIFVENI